MIRRGYSPPYQALAPQLGADNMGQAIKGLISVEVSRTNEVQFAVESFGCDGKPVLSTLRGLPCETSGPLTVAGTKNGMPFRLNADLPRGIGSAIRGAGGGLKTVTGGVALRTSENVLYDNFGNCWSLDQGSTPVYLGETPTLANGDGVTPATCDMDPQIRPHLKISQWLFDNPSEGGGMPDYKIHSQDIEVGWQDDAIGSPVTLYVAPPPPDPPDTALMWKVHQWVPDETTPPDGTGVCGLWPDSVLRAIAEWSPPAEDPATLPPTYPGDGIPEIVSMYPATAPWTVTLNAFTRPLVEHISTGGIADESVYVICHERTTNPDVYRFALRNRTLGTLLFTASSASRGTRTDYRHFWTPKIDEGWYFQNGEVVSDAVTMRRYHSRAASTDNYGTALSYKGTTVVTLPGGAAHAWTAEPVWFRAGRVTRYLGGTPRLWPVLPQW